MRLTFSRGLLEQEAALLSADRLAKLKATGEGTPLYEDFVKDRFCLLPLPPPRALSWFFRRVSRQWNPHPTSLLSDVLPLGPNRQNKRAKYLSDNKTSVEESTDLEVLLPLTVCPFEFGSRRHLPPCSLLLPLLCTSCPLLVCRGFSVISHAHLIASIEMHHCRESWTCSSPSAETTITSQILKGGETTCIDGNQAAAHIAYALTDISFIYPITPSTPMV